MGRIRPRPFSAVLAAVSVCSAVTAAWLLHPMNTAGFGIHNDYLVLQVQNDAQEPAYGSYQLFKNGSEVPGTLTYAQFYSSFAEVNINGAVKSFSDGETVRKVDTDSDGSVVTVKDFDGVEITQRLSFSTGNTANYDMLRIQYTAENKTDENAIISVRIIIDPTIADSESDPIRVENTPCTQETAFTGDSVPETWCIKDADGAITAYGITSDGSAKPDTLDVADWADLYNSGFQYAADGAVSDNAVAVTWSNRTIESGGTLTCGTKYGLYSENSTPGNNTPEPNSPRTGDPVGYVFAGVGLCSMIGAIACRRRRDTGNE